MTAARQTRAQRAIDWRRVVPDGADGLYFAVTIHRHVDPSGWPDALQRVPDEHRETAESYLRTTAARMRVARAAKARQRANQSFGTI